MYNKELATALAKAIDKEFYITWHTTKELWDVEKFILDFLEKRRNAE